MTFVVTWMLIALDQLAAVATARGDPRAVDDAARWVDYTLRRVPYDVGESRQSMNVRVWYGDVLGVYYYVDPDALTVRIVSAGPARRR